MTPRYFAKNTFGPYFLQDNHPERKSSIMEEKILKKIKSIARKLKRENNE
jgi:hypothetical protein